MRKLDMGNIYSPRQVSGPREWKKINNPSNSGYGKARQNE